MKLTVSVSVLALALGACATMPPPAPVQAASEDMMPVVTASARTPEGAREFIARVEKDLFDLSVIGGRAAWVNATYLTDDTDALAAYFGTIGTEKGVAYAKEAAEWARVPGLDADTARKLNILRGALVLAAPSGGGAAAAWRGGRAQHHRDPAAIDLRQGPRHARRQDHHRRRCRGENGHPARSQEDRGSVDQLA
jgi:peptidyl-dipeptidase A